MCKEKETIKNIKKIEILIKYSSKILLNIFILHIIFIKNNMFSSFLNRTC